MNRHSRSAAVLLGVAVLAGSFAAGCARHGGSGPTAGSSNQPTSAVPSVVVVAIDQTPAPEHTAPDAQATVTDTPLTSSSSATPAPAGNPNPTADPVDSELQGANQLLNGIDSSISNSDSGMSGGE